MSKRRRMAQVMSDEAKIAAARKKIVALGLDEKEIMPKLLEKYGVLAYDFVNKAMLEPGRLCNRTGEKFLATKKLIKHYAEDEIDASLLAKAVNKKPEEVKAKAVAYRAEQAHDEETKPVEIKKIERTAEMKSVLVDSVVDRRLPDLGIISIDKLMNLRNQNHNTSEFVESLSSTPAAEPTAEQDNVSLLRPEYNPNTPEGRAKKKAQERLAQLKEGKNGEISFADLEKNGVKKIDMCEVVKPENFSEIHTGPLGKELARNAKKYDDNHGTSGKCLKGVRVAAQDTLGVKKGDYRNYTSSKKAKDSRVLWEKTGDFVTIECENHGVHGNPEIDTLPAGSVVTYENGTNKKAMHGKNFSYYGHVAVKGEDGAFHSDRTDDSLANGKRYGKRYWVSLSKDSTMTDKMAEDMLYQQYLREERQQQFMIARNNQSSRNS